MIHKLERLTADLFRKEFVGRTRCVFTLVVDSYSEAADETYVNKKTTKLHFNASLYGVLMTNQHSSACFYRIKEPSRNILSYFIIQTFFLVNTVSRICKCIAFIPFSH